VVSDPESEIVRVSDAVRVVLAIGPGLELCRLGTNTVALIVSLIMMMVADAVTPMLLLGLFGPT
jgi:hypothetical protein